MNFHYETATLLKTSGFTQFVVQFENSCFRSVWSHGFKKSKKQKTKTVSKSLFLWLEKQCICVWFIESSQCDGELHDSIVGANRHHYYRNVVCSYSGLLSYIMYCMSFSIISVPQSLCILCVCQCHCLNLFVSVTSKDTFCYGRATVVVMPTITSTEPWKNIKTFYDSQVWWKLFLYLFVSVRYSGRLSEGEWGRVVWALVNRFAFDKCNISEQAW